MSELFSGRDIDKERSDVYKEIEKNKADLVAAQETIQRLENESVDLKRRLNKATSFINNLPEDILSELFLDLCNESETFIISFTGLPRQFLIGSVCHHWREIAWRTHGLWRRAFIIFRKAHFDAQKILFEEWLQRSGDAPVELLLLSFATDGWEPPSGAFEKILESCDRWKSLQLSFKSLGSALEKEPTRQFSSLKSIYLHHTNTNNIGPQPTWKLNKPPRLQQLSVSSPANFTLDIDWGLLTSLNADLTFDPSITGPVSINILSSCTSLTELDITFTDEEEHPLTIATGSIHLPNLKRMVLRVHNESWMQPLIQFLNMLTIPSLEVLSLSTVGDDTHDLDGGWLDPLLNLARRSSFKLTSLSLQLGDTSETACKTLIQQLSPTNPIQNLLIDADFSLDGFALSNELISQMIVKPEDSPREKKECLPTLSRFKFVGNLTCSLNSLGRFLKSRSAQIEEGSGGIELSIDILYNNREWLGQQNPNNVQAFYRDVEDLSRRGVLFKLEWNSQSHHGVDDDI